MRDGAVPVASTAWRQRAGRDRRRRRRRARRGVGAAPARHHATCWCSSSTTSSAARRAAAQSRGDAVSVGRALHRRAADANRRDLIALLDEMGAIEGHAADGTPIVDEALRCREPEERVWYLGRWCEGLYLEAGSSADDRAQLAAFRQPRSTRGRRGAIAQGRRAFAIPRSRVQRRARGRRARQDLVRGVARRAQADVAAPALAVRLRVPRRLRADRRRRRARGRACSTSRRASGPRAPQRRPVVTWPDGNGALVAHLAHAARRSSAASRWSTSTRRRARIIAVGRARPVRHRRRRRDRRDADVRREPDRARAARSAARRLRRVGRRERPPARRGRSSAATARRRRGTTCSATARASATCARRTSAAAIAARRSGPGTTRSPTSDPAAVRKKLAGAGYAEWAETILADLERAHPDVRDHVDHIEVAFWGHGMIRPRVGSMLDRRARPRARADRPGALRAHRSLGHRAVRGGVRSRPARRARGRGGVRMTRRVKRVAVLAARSTSPCSAARRAIALAARRSRSARHGPTRPSGRGSPACCSSTSRTCGRRRSSCISIRSSGAGGRALYAGAPIAMLRRRRRALRAGGEAAFWRAIAYLAVFHFIRQQYGWVMLYRARNGERDRVRPLARRRDDLRRDALSADLVARASAARLLVDEATATSSAACRAWVADARASSTRRCSPRTSCARVAVPARAGVVGQAPRRRDDRGVLVRRHRRDEHATTRSRSRTCSSTASRTWCSCTSTRARPRASAPRRQSSARLLTQGAASLVFLVDAVARRVRRGDDVGQGALARPRVAVRRRLDVGGVALIIAPLLAMPQLTHYLLDAFLWRRRAIRASASVARELRATGAGPQHESLARSDRAWCSVQLRHAIRSSASSMPMPSRISRSMPSRVDHLGRREVLRHRPVMVDLGRRARRTTARSAARRIDTSTSASARVARPRRRPRRGTRAASRCARSRARSPRRRDDRAATDGTRARPAGGARGTRRRVAAVSQRRAWSRSAAARLRGDAAGALVVEDAAAHRDRGP